MNKTQVIAGHSITLEAGHRYIASSPMVDHTRTRYRVSIREMTDSPEMWDAAPVATIGDLDYEARNAFLAEFNNGPSSGLGRVW